MLLRWWYAATAVGIVVGLLLQVFITVQAPPAPSSHAVGTLAGAALPWRLVRVASFFTVQSNVLCAIVSAQLAWHSERDGVAWRSLRLASLAGIAVTGIVYSAVLAPVHDPEGWNQVLNNAIFHYFAPVMMVVGWLLFKPRPVFGIRSVRWALIWPVTWVAYTLVHGAITGWYPYPFLEADRLGYAHVALNLLGVMAVVGVVACAFMVSGRTAPRPGLPSTDLVSEPPQGRD